ncbi:MAG: Gfo/Idh/MocA family oxidoreductase [Gammaproteobacteria bacterium]|nr:Gfo/Idh/MocA family oxidoreductase [Gammaproteobacteria bacterium]
MTQNVINVAVAGCGYWGPNLIRNFNGLSDCRLKQICDTDEDRLAYMKTHYHGVETTVEFDQVIDNAEVDAVAIATPVRFHYEMAKKSLEAGKHTFIEKPMASSTAECFELIELAEKKRLTLMNGHTFIYSQPVRKVKEIIDAGDLGKVIYMSSRRLNLGLFQTDINVAWDLAPHDLSIMCYILESSPISVSCTGKADKAGGIEYVTSMTVNFAKDVFATIQSRWLDPNKVREMTFDSKQKMLVYNDVEPIEKIKIYDKGVDTPPGYDSFAEFVYAYRNGDMYSPSLKLTEPLKMECQHFLDCINSGAVPESGGAEGLKVVQVLEAASESLRNNGCSVLVKK